MTTRSIDDDNLESFALEAGNAGGRDSDRIRLGITTTQKEGEVSLD